VNTHQGPSVIVRATDPHLLIDALNEARKHARESSLKGWTPFGVSGPRPAIRGLWKVMRPGVQALVAQAFPCENTPPTAPVLRPSALIVLSGSYEATREGTMQNGASPLRKMLIEPGTQEMFTVPGTRYGMRPIEACIILAVRLAPFPRVDANMVSHLVFRPGDEHVAALRSMALQLLAH
jgi:hypothetical protein